MRWKLLMAALFACGGAHAAIPDFAGAPPKATTPGEATAVFAGGCFWGVDAVFKHVKGVTNVVSGYSGGSAATAKYMLVGTGTTGHAESVKVTYDPSKVGYADLLKVFFSVAHDPTRAQSPGSRRRHAIPLGDLLRERAAEGARAALHRAARRGEGVRQARSSRRWCRSTSSIRPRTIIRTTSRCIPTSRTSSTTTCPSSPS